MSSPKRKVKSSVNQQVKAGLSAIKDFLAGRSAETKVAATEDKATREVVAAELLATLSGRNAGDSETPATESANESQPQKGEAESAQQEEERERARGLFFEHGYFDEAVHNLRAADSASERAAAARVLGVVGSQRGTAHLIAAMFDDDSEVRSAAEEALTQIGEPAAVAPAATEKLKPADAPELTGEAETASVMTDMAEAGLASALSEQVETGSPQSELVETLPDAGEPAGVSVSSEAKGQARGETREEAIEVAEVAEAAEATAQTTSETAIAVETPVGSSVEFPVESAVESPVESPVELSSVVVGLAVAPTDLLVTSEPAVVTFEIDPEVDSLAPTDEQHLLDEENKLRETVTQLQQQLLQTVALREESEQEAERRTEREARRRVTAAERRSEEDERRKLADEEAERLWLEERGAVLVEQDARMKAETEAQRLAEEERSMRLKSLDLQQQAQEFARQSSERRAARLAADEAAQRAEATRLRDEAKLRHDAELARLQSEEAALLAKTAEIAQRQAEVATAREQADADAARLVEAQARMRDAEGARAQAEGERAQLEAEIKQKVEKALELLADTRRRGQEEQERLEEEARRQAAAEQQRFADAEARKAKAEADSKLLADKEQQILAQVNSLRIADAETRRRIADAEVRRHGAEDAYRLVAEKVQRVETEAHARAKEEEQMIAKLEAERRSVAVEAQARAAQEKRIREEIEMFRRLEEQERPRIEEATLQREEAEARLQQQRQQFKAEQEAQARAEEEHGILDSYERAADEPTRARVVAIDQPDQTSDSRSTFRDSTPPPLPGETVQPVATAVSDPHGAESGSLTPVAPAISAYLNSLDPYKRAAAVAELARSRPQEAFVLITSCFDDHSAHVRNAAARALRQLEPSRTVDLFNRALEEASPERKRNIGGAIAASGVATEAIENLVGENREDTYSALSILFVMAKTGEVEPLNRALLEHPDDEIGKAVTKLLALSGHR